MDPIWIGAGASVLVAVVTGVAQLLCQRLATKDEPSHCEKQCAEPGRHTTAAPSDGQEEHHRLVLAVSLHVGGGDDRDGRGGQH